MKLTKAATCPAWVLANAGETGYYRVLYRGGMLDRLDSSLFAMPVVYTLVMLLNGGR